MSICWIRRLPYALSATFLAISVAWAQDTPNSDAGAPLTPAQLKLAVANMLWRDKNLADLQNPAAAIANLGILGHPQIWTAPQTFQGGGTTVDTLTVGRGSGAVAGNVVLGNSALTANVAGVYNTAIGNGALEFVRGIGMRDPETHNGSYNTAIGSVVLQDNIEGIDNTGVGNIALWRNQGDGNTALGSSSLSANTTGNFNTGVGTSTLQASTTGSNNLAAGYSSLYRNTTGTGNVATGSFSLNQNTTGSYNTGLGYSAVWGNTSGNSNVGVGDYALYTNAAGSQNVAVGSHALYANDHGTGNTALGYAAAQAMTAGGFNTAEGNFALGRNTTGSSNVADGNFALGGNTTGSGNSAVGNSALAGVTSGGNNVALGNNAGSHITTGNDNLVLGPNAGTSTLTAGTGNILIGAGKPVDTIDGTTSNEINIAGLLFYNKATNEAPGFGAGDCGNSPSVDAHANNRSGTITAGAGARGSCTMTFAGSGYANWNHCRVTSQSAMPTLAYSYTLKAITIRGTSVSSDKFDYDCDGY